MNEHFIFAIVTWTIEPYNQPTVNSKRTNRLNGIVDISPLCVYNSLQLQARDARPEGAARGSRAEPPGVARSPIQFTIDRLRVTIS